VKSSAVRGRFRSSPHQVLCALNATSLTMARLASLPPRCASHRYPRRHVATCQRGHPPPVSPASQTVPSSALSPTLFLGVVDGRRLLPELPDRCVHPGDGCCLHDGAPRRAIFAGEMVRSALYDRFGHLTSSPERWPQRCGIQITATAGPPARRHALARSIAFDQPDRLVALSHLTTLRPL